MKSGEPETDVRLVVRWSLFCSQCLV